MCGSHTGTRVGQLGVGDCEWLVRGYTVVSVHRGALDPVLVVGALFRSSPILYTS